MRHQPAIDETSLKFDRAIVSALSRRTMLVEPGDSVQQAARLMRDGGCDCALVVSGKTLVGIVTAVDIVRKIIAGGKDPAQAPVDSVMVPRPICARPDMSVSHAIYMMKEFDLEYLPVVDTERRPLGVFSLCDSLLADLESAVALSAAKHCVIDTCKSPDAAGERRYRAARRDT